MVEPCTYYISPPYGDFEAVEGESRRQQFWKWPGQAGLSSVQVDLFAWHPERCSPLAVATLATTFFFTLPHLL